MKPAQVVLVLVLVPPRSPDRGFVEAQPFGGENENENEDEDEDENENEDEDEASAVCIAARSPLFSALALRTLQFTDGNNVSNRAVQVVEGR